MPNPAKYKAENKTKFMRDCLHITRHREHLGPEHSLAKCLNMWRQTHPSKKDKPPKKSAAVKVAQAYLDRTGDQSVRLVHCQGCFSTINYGAQQETAMGAVKCPKCGRTIDQTGKVLDKKTADYPKHPDTVVIGPSGELSKKDKVEGHQPKKFTEKDVWSYYDNIKSDILKDLKGKNLFIRLKTDTGFIYVRHPFGGNSEYIRISNDKDFDTYNNGRTIEFHTTMPATCDTYVVDFDAVGDWGKTKKIAGEIADGLEKLPGGAVSIRYTGKRGFHILKKINPVPIDKARETLKEWLRDTFGDRDDLVVGESPSGSKGALGVSPMKLNGGQVALWSLRVTGLCCVEVPRASLGSFKREDASLEKTYKKLTGKTFSPMEQKEATGRIVEAFIKTAGEVSTPKLALLTWKEIREHYAKKYGSEHHCVKYVCTKCGNSTVCKCIWDLMKYPLVEEYGLCDACCKPETYECKSCHKTNAYYKEFGADCDGGQDEILLYCPDCHAEN